jgi:hypothetical protein
MRITNYDFEVTEQLNEGIVNNARIDVYAIINNSDQSSSDKMVEDFFTSMICPHAFREDCEGLYEGAETYRINKLDYNAYEFVVSVPLEVE